MWPPSEAEVVTASQHLTHGQREELKQLLTFDNTEFHMWEVGSGCLSEVDMAKLTELLSSLIWHGNTAVVDSAGWNRFLSLAGSCQCVP